MAGEERPKQSGPAGFQVVGEGDASSSPASRIPFGTFVLSLSTSALVHLGLVENPETGERGPSNLPLAQQTIDILEMLAEKTRGNLDDEEKQLLESLLHDLRMRFIRGRSGKSD